MPSNKWWVEGPHCNGKTTNAVQVPILNPALVVSRWSLLLVLIHSLLVFFFTSYSCLSQKSLQILISTRYTNTITTLEFCGNKEVLWEGEGVIMKTWQKAVYVYRLQGQVNHFNKCVTFASCSMCRKLPGYPAHVNKP